jgi:hypothetical protein
MVGQKRLGASLSEVQWGQRMPVRSSGVRYDSAGERIGVYLKLCSGPNSVCGLSTGCLGRIPRHSEGIANVRE